MVRGDNKPEIVSNLPCISTIRVFNVKVRKDKSQEPRSLEGYGLVEAGRT
jgi:hypothetical protein